MLAPPSDTEDYVQQIGRGGRDGKSSCTLIFYGPNLMDKSYD